MYEYKNLQSHQINIAFQQEDSQRDKMKIVFFSKEEAKLKSSRLQFGCPLLEYLYILKIYHIYYVRLSTSWGKNLNTFNPQTTELDCASGFLKWGGNKVNIQSLIEKKTNAKQTSIDYLWNRKVYVKVSGGFKRNYKYHCRQNKGWKVVCASIPAALTGEWKSNQLQKV